MKDEELIELCSHDRSLLSFGGDYLKHDCYRLPSHDTFDGFENGDFIPDSQHEIFRIHITQSRPDIYGPAFVEVSIVFIGNFDQFYHLTFWSILFYIIG
jgi:hypothetical protein